MDINNLKNFMQELIEKQPRTADDLSRLHDALESAGMKRLECGWIKQDTLMALETFAKEHPDDKELAGKLWDDIKADTFVTPTPKPRPPRPF